MGISARWSQRVAARVREAVEAAIDDSDLTKHRIAILSGIPKTTFNRRIDGVDPWNVQEIEAVAQVIGVDPDDLIPQTMRSADRRNAS